MTPADFRTARLSLGLTQGQMAPLIGLGDRTRVTHIESGSENISPQVRLLMRAYLSGYRPDDWPAPQTKTPPPG